MTFRQARIRKNLELRARILQAIRSFFSENNYLEVETPSRIPAPIPEAHIEAEPSGRWYLHPSPEICMKQLLAAGYPRIFQICRCFRKDERGDRHLPELTMLEWYTQDADYMDLMTQCEHLIQTVAFKVCSGDVLKYQGRSVELNSPWERIAVADAFDRYSSVSMVQALEQQRFDEIMALEIEPHLGREKPLFIYDYPVTKTALAKRTDDAETTAQRFELYIAGVEICNAFSELTDPDEQKARFEGENDLRRKAGKTVYPMSEHFLAALKDLPAAAGNALGIDRLVMLFAGARHIDDVVAFAPEEL